MPSISQFINYLYCGIYSSYILHNELNKILQEPDWPFVSFSNLKSFCFTCSHSLSLIAICPSLSLDVPLLCLSINDPNQAR